MNDNFRKFKGKRKEGRAYAFISERKKYGEVWEIVENHSEFCLAYRRHCLEEG